MERNPGGLSKRTGTVPGSTWSIVALSDAQLAAIERLLAESPPVYTRPSRAI